MLQARAALRKYKDVMQAAERIFDGEFADVTDDDEDVRMAPISPTGPMSPSQTPYASVCTLCGSMPFADESQTPERVDEDEDLDMQDNEDDGRSVVILLACELITAFS